MFIFIVGSLLLIAFGADTHALIPFYAVGVLASFTISQFGMFVKWIKTKEKGWQFKCIINGFGAFVTLIGSIVVFIMKFTYGAWALLLIVPLIMFFMLYTFKHYSKFYKAIVDGCVSVAEEYLHDVLVKTISYYDYAENYYHGILAGLFAGMETHIVRSNRESGLGRPDIALIPLNVRGTVVIIELKACAKAQDMEKDAQAALDQIDSQNYESEYRDEGFKSFIWYGAAFYKKNVVLHVKTFNLYNKQ